jgi:hypothetical protein
MRMVQMIVDEIVDVIAMRHSIVSAARPVHVVRSMTAADVAGLAVRRVCGIDADRALVDMVAVRVMEVAIVQVVDVTVVVNGAMTAVGAMDVLVSIVNRMASHDNRNVPVRVSTANARARTLRSAHGGALNVLVVEMFEDHVRYHIVDPKKRPTAEQSEAAQEMIDLLKSCL